MITQWHTAKLHEAQCQPESIAHQCLRLRAFLAPVAEQDIAALMPRRAAALYQEVTLRPSLGSSGDTKRSSARAQLESLGEDTLAQLLALLAESKKGGAPAK